MERVNQPKISSKQIQFQQQALRHRVGKKSAAAAAMEKKSAAAMERVNLAKIAQKQIPYQQRVLQHISSKKKPAAAMERLNPPKIAPKQIQFQQQDLRHKVGKKPSLAMAMKRLNQPKSTPKQIQFQQEVVENGEVDRLSALPDVVLLEILSRLPSTEIAIRTGTFSKRWKHLWTQVHSLIFDTDDYDLSLSEFVLFVDKTLGQCCQSKLKKFVVFTQYRTRFESQINSWLIYAIKCEVEVLNFKLYAEYGAECLLDQKLFISSSLTDLKLSGFKFHPSGGITWNNLKRLSISFGKLDEDLIENILSGSPLLDSLVLHRCYGYKMLNITSKSVKKLVFSGYYDPEAECYDADDIIKINASNIISLTIEGCLALSKLSFLDVSCLKEANLDYTKMGHSKTTPQEAEEEMLSDFILNLRHVKELKIGNSCYKVLSRLEDNFDFPSNIKFPETEDGDSVESGDC